MKFRVLLSIFLVASCTSKKTELLWDQSFYRIGSQSSLRAEDLNQDGVLDLVLGAGLGETDSTKQGVLALDGTTGELLWQQATSAMVVGSATFLDINEDGTKDVVIGGRNQVLMALDGRNGNRIWTYQYQFQDDPILQYARYNFYNSVLIPDQNGDGVKDLLLINGGNWDALPRESQERYPGVLMAMDSKTGAVLAADTMPDGQESYTTPIVFSQPEGHPDQLVIGSGGETFGGHLYQIDLKEFVTNGLQHAKILASEKNHGFIAPPVMADVNQDDWLDILTISHAGTILAVDGRSQQILWQQRFEGMESSNALAVGNFTDDHMPDVVAYLCKGFWPDYQGGFQVMIEGEKGEIQWADSLGCGSLASPVAYDLNGDGREEVIFSINEFDCALGYQPPAEASPFRLEHQLVYVDFQSQQSQKIEQVQEFKNLYSTPWLGDLDQDGYLDIVHAQFLNQDNLLTFLGMRVRRISTHIRMKKPAVWGAYLGNQGDGVLPIR